MSFYFQGFNGMVFSNTYIIDIFFNLPASTKNKNEIELKIG